MRVRSDSARYKWELLKYCAEGKDSRFDRIEFAFSRDVTEGFKEAVAQVPEREWRRWRKVADGVEEESGIEWAEVSYVPNQLGHKKEGVEYRCLAIRQATREQEEIAGIGIPFYFIRIMC